MKLYYLFCFFVTFAGLPVVSGSSGMSCISTDLVFADFILQFSGSHLFFIGYFAYESTERATMNNLRQSQWQEDISFPTSLKGANVIWVKFIPSKSGAVFP